jgi:hypothetical protein
MQATEAELASSLNGNLTAHHTHFMLQTIKASIKDRKALISKIDERIEEHLKANERDGVEC